MNIRLYVITFLIALGYCTVNAQILVGPTAGAQLSWVGFEQNERKSDFRTKPSFGYNAGIGLSFRVRNRFFLTSSFLYSLKGKIIESKGEQFIKQTVKYRFIDVPIVYSVDFKVRFGRNNEFKYFFGLGPNINYWLGGKGKVSAYDFGDNLVEREYKIAFDKDINQVEADEMGVEKPNRVQLGLNLATGVVFEPQPAQKIIVLLRYELGHSFFSKESNGVFQDLWYQDNLRSRNKGISLSGIFLIDTKPAERKKGKSTIRKKRMQ